MSWYNNELVLPSLTAKETAVVEARIEKAVDGKEPNIECDRTQWECEGTHKTTEPCDQLLMTHKPVYM